MPCSSRMVLLAVVLLLMPEAARAQDQPPRTGTTRGWAFDRAVEYFHQKDWDNAIKLFEEAFDDTPSDQEIQMWLLEAKSERARAQSAGTSASVISLICTPQPNPEGRKVSLGSSSATPIQGNLKVRIDTAQKSVELRKSLDNYLVDRSGAVAVSDASFAWPGRELPGGVRLSGTMNRQTGQLNAAWLHEPAAPDIPPTLEAFVGVCRPATR